MPAFIQCIPRSLPPSDYPYTHYFSLAGFFCLFDPLFFSPSTLLANEGISVQDLQLKSTSKPGLDIYCHFTASCAAGTVAIACGRARGLYPSFHSISSHVEILSSQSRIMNVYTIHLDVAMPSGSTRIRFLTLLLIDAIWLDFDPARDYHPSNHSTNISHTVNM
ncbi:hypothetical protein MVEN_00707700 [Mycena venus]|uniref:Uncharacterized protein n=1 Tax=Mycena venus TaxID=2733690 RepID=A0A8H6YK97_9AGAR|nr:hypothetical protein MVEN_00707700 [Mycena venus]